MREFKVNSSSYGLKPRGLGQRRILAFMSFLGFAFSYAMRFNISIAIVAMVNSSLKPSQDVENIMFKTDICSEYQVSNSRVESTVYYLSSSTKRSNPHNLISQLNDDKDYNRRLAEKELSFPKFLLNQNLSIYDTANPYTNNNATYSTSNSSFPSIFSTFNNNSSSIPSSRDVESSSQSKSGSEFSKKPLQEMNNKSSVSSHEGDDLDKLNKELEKDSLGEFYWSESDQGLILSSFFWGYIVSQIPGGWLSHRFGGKWPFGIGILITGTLSLITPFAARFGGMECLIAVRIIQGLAGGSLCPSAHTILSNWVPPNERGQLTALAYAGMPVGTAISLLVSGHLINWLGWPSVFYLTGLASIIWFCLWSYLTYSSPDQHPRISQEELKYIQNSIQGDSNFNHNKEAKRPPWKKIWTSLPYWGILCGHAAETWGLYTIMTELPTYMKTVLHFEIQENSLMSAFPHLLTWLVSILLTQLGDFCIERKYTSTGTVRKVCNSIALWGSAISLIAVAYSGCNRILTVCLLAMAVASLGGIYGGVLVNFIDIAPNYAGVLMAISNTLASIPGILSPWVAGNIIDHNPSIERWRLVFLITACVSFTGNLLFVLLSSGEEQPWNNLSDDEDNEDAEKGKDNKGKDPLDVSSFGQFYNNVVVDSIEMSMRTPSDKAL